MLCAVIVRLPIAIAIAIIMMIIIQSSCINPQYNIKCVPHLHDEHRQIHDGDDDDDTKSENKFKQTYTLEQHNFVGC